MSATKPKPPGSPTEAIGGLRRRRRGRGKVGGLILALAVTAAVVLFVFGVIFRVAVVRGNSMEPALKNGDLILVFGLDASVNRGDIVLMQAEGRAELVKRVAGVPGDSLSVDPRSGRLLVNGSTADEKNAPPTMPRPGSSVVYPLVLGEDEYFLLGDNRATANDSRNFGPVPRGKLIGKVILTVRTGS